MLGKLCFDRNESSIEKADTATEREESIRPLDLVGNAGKQVTYGEQRLQGHSHPGLGDRSDANVCDLKFPELRACLVPKIFGFWLL